MAATRDADAFIPIALQVRSACRMPPLNWLAITPDNNSMLCNTRRTRGV